MRPRSLTHGMVLWLFVGTVTLQAKVMIPANVRLPGGVLGPMQVFPLGPDKALADRVRAKFGQPPADGADVAIFRSVAPEPLTNVIDDATAKGLAGDFFSDVLGPSADGFTRHDLAGRLIVARQTVQSNGMHGDIVEDASWFRAKRLVGERPVYGPGSVATLEVRGQTIVSAVVRWDRVTGDPAQVAAIPLSERRLLSEIERQIPDARFMLIDVLSSPELVYYDDRTALYPAYRVAVSVNRLDDAPADRVDVFISAVARPPEAPPPSSGLATECGMPNEMNPPGMRLDRYVLNTDANAWMLNGFRFVAGLTFQQSGLAPRHFCYLESSMLSTGKTGFIDSSHVALVETHGLPGRVQAIGMGKKLEWVDLANVAGYGAGEESLRLLILHSCEVIHTADDDKAGWDVPWLKVFTGLHTVLGYRTTMSISDGVSVKFARHLNDDAPIIRAWFAEVASAYRQDAEASPAGSTKRNGRGAAITVCGEGQRKRSELRRITNPACLESFWFKD